MKDVESPCFDRVHVPTSWVCACQSWAGRPPVHHQIRSLLPERELP